MVRIMGYCARGGHKIRRERLVSDPERIGMLMDRSWVDEPHPQRYLKPIAPDRASRKRSAPESFAEGATVYYGLNGSIYQAFTPFALSIFIGDFAIALDISEDAFSVGGFGVGAYGL